MAVNDTHISVAANGDIRWTGAAETYEVIEFHRWLQLKAYGSSASGDDFLDMVTDTPSDRKTDNIINLLGAYNIDDTMAQHLFAGSIRQGTGGTEEVYSGIQILGAVNSTATQIEIVQDNALLASTFWGDQATPFNGDVTNQVLARFMIKSFTAGAAIDNQKCRVQIRHWGDTYAFFNVQLGDGEAVGAVSSTPDAQNDTLQATVQAWAGGDIPTNTEGYQTIDLNNGNGAQPYYSKWTYNTNSAELKAIWEWVKDLTGNGTAGTIHGINGELFLGITHEYAFNTETGNPFIEDDIITWGTGATAGTGLLLALNDIGATGTVWIQLLTGVAPTNGETISNEAADGTHDVNGAVTSRTIPSVMLGSYTGNLIGAFGIGVDSGDVGSSDKLFDLLNAPQTPPNNVTFNVTGLDITGGLEDKLVVTDRAAGIINYAQLSVSGGHSSGGGTLTVSAAIPTDTPASGVVRALGDLGVYNDIAYTSYTGAVFTLTGTLPDDITAAANAFVGYIDKLAVAATESFTSIYLAPRDLFVRVRNGNETVPIKTFDAPAQLTANGGSIAAIRTPDI